MHSKNNKAALIGLAAAMAMSAGSMAASVNLLTAGSSGNINGAMFQTADTPPGDNDTYTSFLRLNSNGNAHHGYNTSGRPLRFNEDSSDGTQNLRISDLVTRTVDGNTFYEFLLNVNEPTAAGQNAVSLDQLILYTSAIGSRVTSTVSSLGTVRYDLDQGGNNNIIIADRNDGPDARILIPTLAFQGVSESDFVYLFARFGDGVQAQGGMEEFGIAGQIGTVIIPLPTTAGLAMAGLLGLGVRRRR